MMAASEIDRASDALYAIPFDEPEHEFFRTLCAAAAAGLERDTVRDWAAQWDRFNESEFRAHWKGACRPGPVREATLFQKARDAGWTDNSARPTPRPAQAARKPAEPTRKPAPGMSAAEVWERLQPVANHHAYATAKGASPEALAGLRVVPDGDPLRIMGESMAGALVVPCWDGATLVTLQFITAGDTAARLKAAGKPTKLNLPGASVQGWFTVGELAVGGTAYLCEGIGAAWSCWQATGAAAVVAFGWGNVARVAATLRQQDATAKLVICPDVGKEADAKKIASEHDCLVAPMPEGWPDNSDVNDLFLRDGFDVLAALLEAATEPPRPEPRYKLLNASDLRALPPLTWCLRGVLPAKGLAAMFGPSASGKSFLGFDLGAAIAEGSPWFGLRVEQAPVVYLALEGEAGFRQRALAWEVFNKRPLPDGLQMVLQPFSLTGLIDASDLASVVPPGAVVFIDTMNRAAPTANENDSADMGRILEAAKTLQAKTDGLVVLVHHTGKDSTKGLRGHSSLFATLDGAIEVTRDGDRRTWLCAKSKDGTDDIEHPFRLRIVEVEPDEYGEPVTSCVVHQNP